VQVPPAPSTAADGTLSAENDDTVADAANVDTAPTVTGVGTLAAAIRPAAMVQEPLQLWPRGLGMPLDVAAATNNVFPASTAYLRPRCCLGRCGGGPGPRA